MDMSIYPFISISFCFRYFEAQLLGAQTFIIVYLSDGLIFLHYKMSSLILEILKYGHSSLMFTVCMIYF